MKNILLVFLALTLTSCFSDHDHSHHKSESKEADGKQDERISISKDLETAVLKIYAANFQVHQAFVSDNIDHVREAAANLSGIYSAFKTDFPTFTELQKMETALELMQTKEDLDELANDFGEINQVMVDYLLKHDLSLAYNIYYCPMVDKRWIQDSAQVSDVQNPYAIYMLKCGTRETSFNL